MSTKPPSEIKKFPQDSVESKAYRSVEDIPAREPNDRNRLGYHVWKWLTENNTTLEEQIKLSRARLLITDEEAKQKILTRLKGLGVDISQRS